MKPFEFKLARLARVRAAEEEIARARWQSAEHRFRAAERRTEQILEEIAAATDDQRRAQTDPQLAPREVLSIQSSIERLHSVLEESRRQAELLRAAADQEREPWQALRVEISALERLEEKARAVHRREVTREENKEMDQLASERSARTPVGGPLGSFVESTREPRRLRAEC